jgi:hypothetical protein
MSVQLPKNYKELSDEVLIDFKNRIERDLDRVKAQLDSAKSTAISGTYADPNWWSRANISKRYLGRMSQMIQAEFSLRKRLKKESNISISKTKRLTFERIFMHIAKRRLKEEVYDTILKEAEEEEKYENMHQS